MKRTLSVFEYLLSAVMILGGINTALVLLTPVSRTTVELPWVIAVFAVGFAASGIGILAGKIAKSKRVLTTSLLVAFSVCLFSFLIEALVYPGISFWWDNLAITVVAGGLRLYRAVLDRD